MDIFYALAEPTRRGILEMLASSGQLPATVIYDKFHTSPQAVSQHLKVLREARLVQVEKRSQQRIYQINPEAMHDLEEWAKKMTRRWDDRFNTLDEVLRVEKEKLKIAKLKGQADGK